MPAGFRKSSVVELVPVVGALLLLFAAGLKCHQLASFILPEVDLASSRWFIMLLVEAELVLGLALLLGVYPGIVRLVAALCFYAFLAMNVYWAISGRKYCPCFGDVIRVSPLVTALLDAAVLVGLLCWRPSAGAVSVSQRQRLVLGVTVYLLLGLPALFAMLRGAHRGGVSIEVHRDNRLSLPVTIDLEHSTIAQLLETLRERSGVQLRDETSVVIEQDIDRVESGPIPCYRVMDLIAQKKGVGAHWEAVEGGYRLVDPPLLMRFHPRTVFLSLLGALTTTLFFWLIVTHLFFRKPSQ